MHCWQFCMFITHTSISKTAPFETSVADPVTEYLKSELELFPLSLGSIAPQELIMLLGQTVSWNSKQKYGNSFQFFLFCQLKFSPLLAQDTLNFYIISEFCLKKLWFLL